MLKTGKYAVYFHSVMFVCSRAMQETSGFLSVNARLPANAPPPPPPYISLLDVKDKCFYNS